jgi:hypothetical protein
MLILTKVLMILTGFFSVRSFWREVMQIIFKKRSYLNFWNLVDLTSIVLNLSYLIILIIHISTAPISRYRIN